MELPVVISLNKPLKHGDKEIEQLVIEREMVAGDLRGVTINALKFDDIFLVASRLTGVPTSVITQMSMPDTMRLQAVIDGFFEGGQ